MTAPTFPYLNDQQRKDAGHDAQTVNDGFLMRARELLALGILEIDEDGQLVLAEPKPPKK